MLQPSQLEDVSARFAAEIVEVREFLTTAGMAVGSPQVFAQVAQRLRSDRGFHRDLTSHVWVLLHRRGESLRYGETLGVLAVAAAGPRLAATADEDAAHDLLRFVMEAHDGLTAPKDRTASPAPKPAPSPVLPIRPVRAASDASSAPAPALSAEFSEAAHAASLAPILPRPPLPEPVAEDAMPVRAPLDMPLRMERVEAASAQQQDARRRTLVWATLAPALLLVSLAGWWMMHRRPSDAPAVATAPAPVIDNSPAATTEPLPTVVAPEQPETTASTPQPSISRDLRHHAREASLSHTQHAAASAPQVHATAPPPVQVASATPANVAGRTAVAPTASRPAGPAMPTIGPAMAASKPAVSPVPANALSKQLGTPGMTKQQEAEYDATGRRYPRLLRRTPASNDPLMAKATVPAPPGNNAGSAPAGTVRPTSLGVMASNLVYSPAAAYPPEASAAHVQGSVKLEAVVDPAGNVAAARVISGPPQLRDAALNAVQQWRFKPYIAGGKARSFTTEALMDFQLP